MFEFKIKELTEEQIEILNNHNFYPIENIFGQEHFYLIYGDKNVQEKLKSLSLKFEVKTVNETGWEDKWKEFLKPGNLTNTIKYGFDLELKDEKTIIINPAMAFGTGTHSTTQIAACLLETIVENKRMIDIGCGSGILSIAGELMGAKEIIAMDIDYTAVMNAKENININGCNKILLFAGEVNSVNLKYKPNIICANIISSVLLKLRDNILEYNPEYIILSGILISEFELFKSKFMPSDYYVSHYKEDNKWCGFLLSKVK
jgi:ribosomal protein L11 methyltransferase